MKTAVILLSPPLLTECLVVLISAGVQIVGLADSSRFEYQYGGVPFVALRIASDLLPPAAASDRDLVVVAMCDRDASDRIVLKGFETCIPTRSA